MKPILELSFRQASQQEDILRESRDLFYQRVVPVMERVMDASSGEEELRRFDRIEIDLGVIRGSDWKNRFAEQVQEALKEKLHNELPATSMEETDVISQTDVKFQALFFYLEKGYLPWWSPGMDPAELLSFSLARHSDKLKEQLAKSRNKEKVFRRLVSRIEENDLEEIILLVSQMETLPGPYRELMAVPVGDLRESLKRTFLYRLLIEGGPLLKKDSDHILEKIIAGMVQDIPGIIPLFREALKKKELQEPLSVLVERVISKDREERISPEDNIELKDDEDFEEEPGDMETNEIYIRNAGLILLHPFLEELFNRFDLLDGKKFRDPFSREQAAWLISFLVDNEGQGEESMVLNKILCGMNPSDTLFYAFIEADDAREACDELLRSALSHWPSMEGTSPAALRETWLHREGKIVAGDGRWSLKVERKAVDILLEKVPWTFSVVKLPWMEEILYVEW